MSQPIVLEKTAKTVEEALRSALTELELEEKDVEVFVLEEPSKGFLGLIGTRPARVRITVKPDPMRDAVRFIQDIFRVMGIQAEIKPEWRDSTLFIGFSGDDLGILIGRRGDTLDSLQYLVNLAVNRQGTERVRILLDVENYRQRREETLVRLAKRLSEKVKRTGVKVVLEPMNPQERRIIHTTLQGDPRVVTYSEGEEPFRKVVIGPKIDNKRPRTEGFAAPRWGDNRRPRAVRPENRDNREQRDSRDHHDNREIREQREISAVRENWADNRVADNRELRNVADQRFGKPRPRLYSLGDDTAKE
ncbi:single-stranded nucleic acid binding r3h [Heliomicrobium modesticaldum Ice1]|uniref:RNA-binding protein KhpB n=1 Tax=Heliobacterium modesticaldum (strain ATCC 51547 / Ice1) TaxID=498761 RepID=B0TAB7_HELMI|nr:single-stranded nucleic acid binding r3h [Heliomicrobium modesticaldum Ice1]